LQNLQPIYIVIVKLYPTSILIIVKEAFACVNCHRHRRYFCHYFSPALSLSNDHNNNTASCLFIPYVC